MPLISSLSLKDYLRSISKACDSISLLCVSRFFYLGSRDSFINSPDRRNGTLTACLQLPTQSLAAVTSLRSLKETWRLKIVFKGELKGDRERFFFDGRVIKDYSINRATLRQGRPFYYFILSNRVCLRAVLSVL